MLTADGMTAATAAANRRFYVTTAACMAGAAAYMGAWMAVAAWHGPGLREFTTGYFGPVIPELLWGLTVCPVAFLVPGGLLIHVRRERLRPDPWLACPACGESISNAAWVIASRRCGRCVKPILVEPEEFPPMLDQRGRDDRLIAIDDFTAAAAGYDRKLVFVFAGLVAGLAAVAGFAFLVGPALGQFTARNLGPTAREGLPILTIVALVGGFVAGLCLVERNAGRDPRLSCPWCGKPLVNLRHLAIATRNCGHCGRQALAKRTGDFT